MVFKGSERRGVSESAAAVEGLGGDLNAWTSWDETTLHATVAADGLLDALDVLFDMARSPRFDATELEREKLVVLEEIRSYADDPDSVAADQLHALVFGDHPYGRPVIGSVESVARLDRDAAEAYWRQHWHPGRALLAVAGPVDADQVLAEASRLSTGWAAGAARGAARSPRPPTEPRVEKVKGDFGSVVVTMGWPGAPVGHADVPALDVLCAALGQGAAARLSVLLDLDAGVASHVFADSSSWLGGGMIAAGFLCGETEEALRMALEELARVARSGLGGSEVVRARDGILADLVFGWETSDGVAADLAWNVARMGGPAAREAYRAAVAAVTPAQVRDVARRWLDPARAQIVVVDKQLQRRKLQAAVKAARRPVPARRRHGIEHHDLKGLRVALLPDASEVAAVQVVATGGQLVEDARNAGAAEAWARAVLRGAGDWDAVAFSERSDALAAYVDASAGRSQVSVSASFPAANTLEALELVGELLVDPIFDPEDWHNVREELLDDLEAVVDRPGHVADEALHAALWPGHPWRLPALGTAPSLERVGPRTLRRIHRAMLARDGLVVAVTGGFEPDDVLRVLEGYAEELPSAPALPAVPEPGAPGRAPVRRSAGQHQATVLLGVRGVAHDHPDRTALAVACHVLDSQSGRLFLRLREELGLAYGVWARSTTMVGGGVFQAGLSTDPSRAAEASEALSRELLRLAAEGPAPDELARTCRMIHGLAAMRHERVLGRATDLAWSVYSGRPYGLDALRARLDAVTPEVVRDALARLELARAVEVVVLPR